MIPLYYFVILSALIFIIAIIGIIFNKNNIIMILICIELLLLAINTNFVSMASFMGDLDGQVLVFFVLAVAAAESAIGLAILVILFRHKNTVSTEDVIELRG